MNQKPLRTPCTLALALGLALLAGPGQAGCANDARPREALDEVLAAHARGDLAALIARLDPGMFGYTSFLDAAQRDFARAKLVRTHLFDMQWQCGPDLVAVQTRWEKRYLDSVTYQPQLDSGRMSVLLFRHGERWRLAAVSGAHPFGSGGGVPASIEFGPTLTPLGAASPLQLVVADADLADRAHLDVVLRTSTGDREPVRLPAVAPGRFQLGTLPMVVGTALAGNGTLEVAVGGRVLLEVVDGQPGPGRPAVLLRRYAQVVGSGTGLPPDTTPDPLVFAPVPPQAPGALVVSSAATLSGINAPAPAAVAGGEVSVDGGAFTAAPGPLRNGAQLRLRTTASPTPGATVSVLLTVGGVVMPFTVATAAGTGTPDLTPDPFSFAPVGPVRAEDAGVLSNQVVLSGLGGPTPLTVANGEYELNGVPGGSDPALVNNGDRLALRAFPVATPAPTTALATVGTYTASFMVTWVDADPDPLLFAPATAAPATLVTSNTAVFSGVNVPLVFAVSGGSVSVNGGAFGAGPVTLRNGDRVTLRTTSAAAVGAVVTVRLSAGATTFTWTVTSR